MNPISRGLAPVLLIGLVAWLAACHPDYRADVNLLAQVVEDNYPWLPGSDPGQRKRWDEALGKLRSSPLEQLDFKSFLQGVFETLRPLGDHAYPLSPAAYQWETATIKKGYLSPREQVLQDSRINPVYKAGTAPFEARKFAEKITDSFCLENRKRWLYLKLPTFYHEPWLIHQKDLRNFLLDPKHQNLPVVIDIRGNAGGNPSSWSQDLVANTLDHQISYSVPVLLTAGREAQNFFEPYTRQNQLTLFPTSGLNPALPEDARFFTACGELRQFFPSRVPRLHQGKRYLLVDKGTFSAGDTFAQFAKRTGWATVVGQPTGGAGFESPMLFVLPASGLIISLPYYAALNPDGTFNRVTGTVPDVVVPEGQDALKVVEDRLK